MYSMNNAKRKVLLQAPCDSSSAIVKLGPNESALHSLNTAQSNLCPRTVNDTAIADAGLRIVMAAVMVHT